MDPERHARAWHRLDVGRPQECLDLLQDEDPHDGDVVLLRAVALARLERWDECCRVAAGGLAIDPDPALHRVLASAHGAAGRWLESEQVALAGLREDPEDVGLMTVLAENLVARRHGDRAAELLARARAREPEDVGLLVLQSRWCEEFGSRADAVRWAEKAMEVDPTDPQALHHMGRFAVHRGDGARGLDLRRRAALEHFSSTHYVEDARRADLLGRRPWRWFVPALRVHPGVSGGVGFVALWTTARLTAEGVSVGSFPIGAVLLGAVLAALAYVGVAHAVALVAVDD